MNETAKSRSSPGFSRTAAFLCASLALALAGCSKPAEPPLAGASLGGPFALVGEGGKPVRDTDFKGKYRIVYFGFTHCPDVCPTDLAAIGQGLRRFEKKDQARAARVQPIFITVDPERDTPPVVKTYVAAFHPRLVGLTGTREQIAAAAKSFSVYYKKEPVAGGSYTMNHSRIALLFGPEGEPVAILPSEEGAEAVAADLDRWVR